MRLVRFLAVALVAAIGLQSTVSVAQLPPTRFYGTVILNGEAPPIDSLIRAYIGEQFCGEGRVLALDDPIGVGFFIDVFAESYRPGCGTDGATVTFRVSGVPANETGTFQTGSFIQLDLTADGEPTIPPSPVEPIPARVPQPEPQPEPQPAPEPTPEPEPAPEG